MNPKMVLLLLLMGCYTLDAKMDMGRHFGVQACSTDLCTTATQRKWVGSGAPCEACGHANSTFCYEGSCTSGTCKVSPTCAKVNAGATCDSAAASPTCCDYSGSWCETTSKKCIAWQTSGQPCNITANQMCNPTTLMCNSSSMVGVCISKKALGTNCSSSTECLDGMCWGTSAAPTVDMKCKVPVAGGASCDSTKNICGQSRDCASNTCTLGDKGAVCQYNADCKSGECDGGKCAVIQGLGQSCVAANNEVCRDETACVSNVCTAYRSIAKGGNAIPTAAPDVNFCKYGLFIDGGKCTDTKSCVKDDDCGVYGDFPLNVICAPTGTGCSTGKCAVLAASCGSLIDDAWADPTNTDKESKAMCCVDAATNQANAQVKAACKKSPETPSKSGAASSLLATSAVFVALLAGFFVL